MNIASMWPAITCVRVMGVVSNRCSVLDLRSSTSAIADVFSPKTTNWTIIPGDDWV